MTLCVRSDLKMKPGKVAVQCCHGALGAFRLAEKIRPQWVSDWDLQGQPKIALEIESQNQMEELERKARELRLPVYIVEDAGRTEVVEGSKTVLAIGPAPTFQLDRLVGELNTY